MLEQIIEQIIKSTELQKEQIIKLAEAQKVMADTDQKLVDIIAFLQKIVSILIFVTFLLVWRVFLWDYINNSLIIMVNGWKGLTEGYKILILGLIGSIPAGIITTIISLVITEKIKAKFKKKK